MDHSKGSARRLKEEIYHLLTVDDPAQIWEQLCQFPMRKVTNVLFSFLSSVDQLTKWRAVAAMGLIVSRLAEEDPDWARAVMRRLMWSLNDESGGIGWGAPEAMGEIMARHSGLADEFSHMLISYLREDGNYLENDTLRQSAVWAIGRLAQIRPEILKASVPHLLPYLESKDPVFRGLAVWTMQFLRTSAARLKLENLSADETLIRLYWKNSLSVYPIKELAKQALSALALS